MARAKYEEWLTPDGLTLLRGWRREGLKLEQIAHNIGITAGTLSLWQQQHKEIKEALKKGREGYYYEVVDALHKSARGYTVKEQEEVINYDSEGHVIGRSTRVRSRYIPPQLGAQCFILKNDRPDIWQDKPERIATDEIKDDGFLDALKGSAADDWQDDDNITADEELESGDLINEE